LNNVPPSGPVIPQSKPKSAAYDGGMPELPSVPTDSVAPGGNSNDVDFDDLTRRFEALKKKK
jgi:vacuolar protein sorting-associated protein IST1